MAAKFRDLFLGLSFVILPLAGCTDRQATDGGTVPDGDAARVVDAMMPRDVAQGTDSAMQPDSGGTDGGVARMCPSTPTGTTYYVAADGDDSASGTTDHPFLTANHALAAAMPGDRVLLRAGTYHERVTFPRSGTSGHPIILEGMPGAVIDGGDHVTGWVPAPEVGPHVYKNTSFTYLPWNMTWNGNYVLHIRDDISQSDGFAILSDAPLGWDSYGGTLYRSWDGIEAMFGTYSGVTYVRFGTNNDPNAEDLTFAPQREGVVNVVGSSYVTVCNLTLRNAGRGVDVKNSSDHVIVDGNTIIGGNFNVLVESGSSDTVISHNELTLGYLHSLDPNDPRHWFIWAGFKLWSDYDRGGVVLYEAGSRNVVSENHIFQQWDGIQDEVASTQTSPDQFSQDLDVGGNVIEFLGDDGLEPTGSNINGRWHDNFVHDCNIDFRVKMAAGGPMYVYRNRLITPGDNDTHGENLGLYFYSGTTVELYLYHNSISAYESTALGSTDASVGVGHVWYMNNILSSGRFGNGAGNTAYPHFDYNWVGGDGTMQSYMGPHNVIATGQTMWAMGDLDLFLPASTPARQAGIDLSVPWTVDGVTRPALPGMTPGYFTGSAPNLGYRP